MGIGDLIGTVIAVAIFAIIVVPIVSMAIVAALTLVGLQFAVVGALVGYIVGIPWAVWFRATHGRWPQS